MRDLHNHIDMKVALAPLAAAIATNVAQVSAILDKRGFDSVELAILTGALVTGAATYTVLVEHGDNAGLTDAAAVPDDMLIGTEVLAGFIGTNVNACRKIGYIGDKRYVRATITPASNAGAAPMAAMWLMGRAQFEPTANPPV
jgi:hypothetical protein